MANYDVIIIGAGAIGSFSLFHLQKRGIKKCLLIEKEDHSGRGATGSWGSLIRTMHQDPLTTIKATKAVPFFRHFKEVVGNECGYNNCGALYFFKKDQLALIDEQLNTLKESRISFEVIESAEGSDQFPHFNWFDDDLAIFEHHAGTACPYMTTSALINYATKRGANALFGEHVSEIIKNGHKVLGVKTTLGKEFFADAIIVTAGRWSQELALSLGCSLGVSEKNIQINRFCRGNFKGKLPLFIDRNLYTFGHFFIDGSFVGGYLPPDQQVKESTSMERLSLQEAVMAKMKISRRLKCLKNSSLAGGLRGIETYSSDGQGIIANDFGYENLIFATGFSCTGFTLAPLAGEEIATLIEKI